jgi:hypothetical protein
MRAACAPGGAEQVIYTWGGDAPPTALPPDTAFALGPGTAAPALVLQVHYLAARPAGDRSGARLTLSPVPTRFAAGVINFVASFTVPPRAPAHRVPNRCCYSGFETLEAFAALGHTHALGRAVWLDHGPPAVPGAAGAARPALARAATRDPQQPQEFYPLPAPLRIRPGDALEATCEFDASMRSVATPEGPGAAAEMCNLFLMLRGELPFSAYCLDGAVRGPADGGVGAPPAARLEPAPAGWALPRSAAAGRAPLGQLAGVAASAGALDGAAAADGGTGPLVWALRRAARDGKPGAFDAAHRLQGRAAEVPLPWPAVLRLRRDTGALAAAFGADFFYAPHSITEDPEGNVWVADGGLHQALKFSPVGELLLTLGARFEPGAGNGQLCRPTHVVVGRDGTIYVGDGYCNSRVSRFAPDGAPLGAWALPATKYENAPPPLPHSLALDECRRRLYVADRAGARVLALDLDAGGALAAEWDFSGGEGYGTPTAVRVGPHGAPVVLLRGRGGAGAARVAALGARAGEVASVWEAPGARAPHDLELASAPLAVSGAGERLLAVLIAEAAEEGPTLRRYVLRGGGDDEALAGLAAEAAQRAPRSPAPLLGALAAAAALAGAAFRAATARRRAGYRAASSSAPA